MDESRRACPLNDSECQTPGVPVRLHHSDLGTRKTDPFCPPLHQGENAANAIRMRRTEKPHTKEGERLNKRREGKRDRRVQSPDHHSFLHYGKLKRKLFDIAKDACTRF